MAYLDVRPMVIALRTSAADFKMDRGWLHHFPSHHRFKINDDGEVRLLAHCDCSRLAVTESQGSELREAFREWRGTYWRMIEINREFESHFAQPGFVRRLARRLIGRVRLALLAPIPEEADSEGPSMIPAE